MTSSALRTLICAAVLRGRRTCRFICRCLPIQSLQSFTQLTLKSRIADAALDLGPFPQLVITAVLPPFTVSDLYDYWPSSFEFAALGADGDGTSLPLAAVQHQSQTGPASADRMEYWQAFEEGPVQQILTALYACYVPVLRARFRDKLPKLQLETNVTLVTSPSRDAQTVCMGHPAMLFEALIYLQPGNGCFDVSLHEPREAGETHDGLAPLSPEGFRTNRVISLRNNTLVSYLRTANSFHQLSWRSEAVATGHAIVRMQVRLTEDCVDRLYGDDVGMLFRRGLSGHCPWLMPTFDAWRSRSWDSETDTTDAELRPLLDSFERRH